MKFKPVIFPELLKFSHIFSTKRFGDHLNRKEKLFPIVFPMIFRIQSSTKNNRMDMRMKVHGTSPCMEDTNVADILSLIHIFRTPNHGYGIVQKVKELTDNEVVLGPGTMYGSLSKMEKDGLIHFIREEDKRKIYEITELGTEVLELELKRIRRLYRNAQEVTR